LVFLKTFIMKISRLIKNIYPLIIFIFTFCFILLSVDQQALSGTDPERQLIVNKVEEEPAWKMKWDEVRQLVREQKYVEAAKGYGELLTMKSNIEVARWEYLQLLIRLNEWALGSNLVESLIERNPQSIQYQLSGGRIALARKEFARAAKYFGWAFTKSPNSSHGLTALQGLIDALRGLGRDEKIFPLIEHLRIRKPQDPDLLRELAIMAMQQGRMAKASHYFSTLIDQFPVDDRIIFQTANLYDQMGKRAQAALYWKDYLAHHPEYLPFQKKISDYYLSINNKNKALPHLLILLENGDRSDELLLKIGQIYLHDQKRPARALVYLEEYSRNNPGNETVKAEISEIRTVLANNLISIVENDGAWMLWKDLAQLTPDRIAIYLSMVDVLESLDKEDELYEILTIIHQQEPDNQKALLSLAEIELRRGRVSISVDYFTQVAMSSANEQKYLLVQAKIQENLGNELSALKKFELYLRHDSENKEILLRCLELSGRLGLVSHLKTHFNALKNCVGDQEQLIEIEKNYLAYLRKSHLCKESDRIHNNLMNKIGDDPIKTTTLLFAKSDFLYNHGLVFEAEQLIRRVLISNIKVKDALVKLVELSMNEGEIERGWAWFSLLRGQESDLSEHKVDLSSQDPEVTLLQAKLLSSQNKDDEAIALLKNVLFSHVDNGEKQLKKMRKDHALLLVHIYVKKGLYQKGLKLVRKLRSLYPSELEVQVLLNRIQSVLSGKEVMPGLDYSFSQLVQLAQYELKYDEIKNGLHLIEEALRRVKSSVLAKIIKIKLLRKDGQYVEALTISQELLSEFPSNQYFEKVLMEIELARSNAAYVIKEYTGKLSVKVNGDNEERGFVAWKKMLLAKSFQAVNKHREALDIYNSMIKRPVEEILVERLKKANISVNLPTSEKSLWDMITFSTPKKVDLTEIVMDPDYVGKHLGKLVDIVTTELYDEYRWQKLILTEKSIVLSHLHSGNKRE